MSTSDFFRIKQNQAFLNSSRTSFWGGQKHFEEVEILNLDVPVFGNVTDKSRPKLEEWRKLSNAYYRYYNDGESYMRALRHMAKRYDVKLEASNPEALEDLADAVFAAAIDEYNNL